MTMISVHKCSGICQLYAHSEKTPAGVNMILLMMRGKLIIKYIYSYTRWPLRQYCSSKQMLCVKSHLAQCKSLKWWLSGRGFKSHLGLYWYCSEIVEDLVGLEEKLDMYAFIGQNLLVRLVLDASLVMTLLKYNRLSLYSEYQGQWWKERSEKITPLLGSGKSTPVSILTASIKQLHPNGKIDI